MNNTIKIIAFSIILSLPFFFNSCTNTNDTPERTAETEQQELNQVIANLEKANYNVDTTDLGVYYVMSKSGTGPLPFKGDTCYLIYTGFFLDGIIFDMSADHFQDSIWQIIYKEENLIPGFVDAIGLLNKGAEADVIIPSELAYGSQGKIGIPPYTPLVFSLKMRDLKPKAQ
jgi:FKBP-type peptidyl-prolyl cis-trans isomerase FkpA